MAIMGIRRRAGFGLLLLCLLIPATGSAGEGGFGAWTGSGTGDPPAEARVQFLFPIEEAKLTASDAAVGDSFGNSVSISGDKVVAGAIFDDDACPADLICDSGSAYVYRFVNNAGVHGCEGRVSLSAHILVRGMMCRPQPA